MLILNQIPTHCGFSRGNRIKITFRFFHINSHATRGAKYRFRNLYPNYNKPFGQEWVAKLRVKATPTFPDVNAIFYKGFKGTFDNLKKNPGNKSLLKSFFLLTRDLFNDIQWDQFVKNSPSSQLLNIGEDGIMIL